MKKLIIIITAIMTFGCSNPKEDIEIDLRITFVAWENFQSKEDHAIKTAYIPVIAVMTTDRGTFHFDISERSNSWYVIDTSTIRPGEYFISDVSLYDIEGFKTHYMKKQGDSNATSWVGTTWNFETDGFNHIMQVFYN